MEEPMGMDEGLYCSYWDEDTMLSTSHNWKAFSYLVQSENFNLCVTCNNFGLSFVTDLN